MHPYLRALRLLVPYPTKRQMRRWFPHYWERNTTFILQTYGIDLVVDVGANIGQYGATLYRTGYTGKIISFEPQEKAHAKLKERAARYPGWSVADRLALDRRSGTGELLIPSDGVLGSLLAPQAGTGLTVASREKVRTATLDEVYGDLAKGARKVCLKIDVQGHELAVLEGAANSLPRIAAVQLELSLIPSYVGATYYLDVLNHLYAQGFLLVFVSPVVSRLRRGLWHEMDGLLVRDPALQKRLSEQR
jgi:FkbM family methyltransferase